jgi:hypothetical protein
MPDDDGVRFRHISEVPIRAIDVRSLGKGGRHMLALSLSGFDPKRSFAASTCCGRVADNGCWRVAKDSAGS